MGKEWLHNPLYESKLQSARNAKPLPDSASPSPASSKPNDLASCKGKEEEEEEEEDGLLRDDRGKDLNERPNDEEESALSAVRRLKERLRDMGEELERVRAAADKISVGIDELHSETETKSEEEGCTYTVEEPDEEETECEVGVKVGGGGGGGLVITEVTSPTPSGVPMPDDVIRPRFRRAPRPRPHSLWGEDAAAEGEGEEGGDLFGGRRYEMTQHTRQPTLAVHDASPFCHPHPFCLMAMFFLP